MSGAEIAGKAGLLRSLHRGQAPLVLPNAWDAASARLVEAAGFPVVATGSAAVAASLGFDDHEKAPAGEMLAAARRICEAVSAPVTIDVEAGYGLEPQALAESLITVGAAGCNLEDTDHASEGPLDAGRQAARIAALREAALAAGADLVVNARIDVFIGEWGESAGRLDEAVRRGRLYLEAGADCVYPIWLVDESVIEALVAELDAPVNVLYRPGAPSLARLAELGVRRISFGPGIHRVAETATKAALAKIAAGSEPY
jgi:2-methylisocitrate lyase-like PEP mutase family enzyme